MAKTNPTGADGKRHHENLHTDSCSWRAMSINSAHHSTASSYEQVTDSRPAYFFALTLLSLEEFGDSRRSMAALGRVTMCLVFSNDLSKELVAPCLSWFHDETLRRCRLHTAEGDHATNERPMS